MPHTLPLQLRFNDIDTLGHVNNTIYFSYYDLGKARYFESVRGETIDWRQTDIVVAHIEADFLSPIFLNEPIGVETSVIHIGNKSFKMRQQIINTDTHDVKCVCFTIMVAFDTHTGEAKPLSEEWKKAIIAFEKNPDLMQ